MHLPSAIASIAALGLLTYGFPLRSDRVVASRDAASQAQRINQRDFNVLQTVLPPVKANGTTVRDSCSSYYYLGTSVAAIAPRARECITLESRTELIRRVIDPDSRILRGGTPG